MDENLKASVTEVVGQILDLRQKLASNRDRIRDMHSDIKSMETVNRQIKKELDHQRRLLDYVLETGEDPVAASLALNSQELAEKTERARDRIQGALGATGADDDHWYNRLDETQIRTIEKFRSMYNNTWTYEDSMKEER